MDTYCFLVLVNRVGMIATWNVMLILEMVVWNY